MKNIDVLRLLINCDPDHEVIINGSKEFIIHETGLAEEKVINISFLNKD